ncbi:hypothetical protein [Glycomyces xiaoerkulensis]|uniref:hypothetical protein n=1 Tax=Glycomyces xiaoerkulensis TaxID=2038139 RepID=UPI000C26A104|nr:hypothetical protein [Glycomyces xiaoerkulensis]
MSGRVVPYHCPYCGEEDLRPYEPDSDNDVETRGGWHCSDCTRVFTLKYHGMATPAVIAPPDTAGAARPKLSGGLTPPDPESE